MKLFLSILALFSICATQAQPFNGFLSLDGSDDYIVSSDSLFRKQGDKTVECFLSFCPNSTSVSDAGLFTFNSSMGVLKMSININASGSLANIKLDDGKSKNAFNISIFKTNVWNHLAFSYADRDSSYSIYFNGDSLGKFSSSVKMADTVLIGNGNNFLSANLDELRFSDTLRYSTSFSPPTSKFQKDPRTVDIFRFDDGKGARTLNGVNGKNFVGENGGHSNEGYFVSPDTSICRGDSIVLLAKGGSNYKWIPFNSISSDSIANPIFNGDSTVAFGVEVGDSNTCVKIENVIISIRDVPQPMLGSDTSVCNGDSMRLTPGVFNAYLWSNGSVSSFIEDGRGDYWVRVKDSLNCTSTDSIHIGEYSKILLDIGPDTIVRFGTILQLDAGAGFAKYRWSTLDNTQRIWVNLPIKYSVTVTDSNGCTTSDTMQLAFNTIGVEERYQERLDAVVFPNPVKRGQNVKLMLGENQIFEDLCIVDQTGKLVYYQESEEGNISLPTSELKAGIYYLKIKLGESDNSNQGTERHLKLMVTSP